MFFSHLYLPFSTQKIIKMDLKQIQDLVKMVNKSNISELTIEEKEPPNRLRRRQERQTDIDKD